MTLNINNVSVVQWFPYSDKHRCGYCKSEDGSTSYGMWADRMTVNDYQNLIDRGWRRSGKYCYKPIMNEICCPQYTIRCDALNFKMSKSQKKIIKKFNKYLNDGTLQTIEQTHNIDESFNEFLVKDRPNISIDYKSLNVELRDDSSKSASTSNEIPSCSRRDDLKHENQISAEIANKKVKIVDEDDKISINTVKKGLGADPNKPPCKKAKLLRIERKKQKMSEKGLDFVKTPENNEAKALEDFLNEISEDSKHKLKIKLVRMNQNDTFCDFDTEHELYKKYQMIIHNDPPQKCTKNAFSRFLVNSPLKITLERMNTKHKDFEVSFKLFAKYQITIHGDSEDDCDMSQFDDFLVTTPLEAEKWENDDNLGYGSFHQQYWIDDKLIAVGVVDILPKCISSVYFFYDPDYRSLTLGTYGSLREINFASKLNRIKPNINYYYMGFYIHSCLKMRYKGKLIPSYLLCPETYQWFPITECIPKLEISKYCRFNDDSKAVDEQSCTRQDIDRIKIYMTDGYVHFSSYPLKHSEGIIYENIGKLIGKKCIDSLLFVKQ